MPLLLELHRLIDQPKELQLGVLKVNGLPAYTTCELPYRDNEVGNSSVRAGEYKIAKIMSPKFKTKVWELQDVEGRSNIEIHPLQFKSQSHGCIGVGRSYGFVNGVWTILDTQIAFRNLMFQTEPYEVGQLYIWDE